MVLASAPQPGSRRVIRSGEILSLARRLSIPIGTAPDVCFEWRMGPLDREQARAAMYSALQLPDAQIEIEETSSYPVPQGQIEFPRERLGAPASPDQRNGVLWRGDVLYGGSHRYAIWAKVRITAQCEEVVAAQRLNSGQPISLRELRAESVPCFPAGKAPAPSIDAMTGLLPIRPIAAGEQIPMTALKAPYEIVRGDLVEVQVYSGAVRLAFTGKAESSGYKGGSISIRNPRSNRIFQARITGKDEAVIQAGTSGVN
jgi:flagella basal body P-ring formation protein FlgA